MKLIPYDVKKLPTKTKMYTNEGILNEFINSGEKCVQVKDYPHVNARSFYTSFWKSIKTFGFEKRVKIRVVGKDAFLVRTDL